MSDIMTAKVVWNDRNCDEWWQPVLECPNCEINLMVRNADYSPKEWERIKFCPGCGIRITVVDETPAPEPHVPTPGMVYVYGYIKTTPPSPEEKS